MIFKVKNKKKWKKTTSPKDKFYPRSDVYVSDAYISDNGKKIISVSKYKGKKNPYWTSLMIEKGKKLEVIKDKKSKTRKQALKIAEIYKK